MAGVIVDADKFTVEDKEGRTATADGKGKKDGGKDVIAKKGKKQLAEKKIEKVEDILKGMEVDLSKEKEITDREFVEK